MKIRSMGLAAIVAGTLAVAPAWADRGYGHGYNRGGGYDHFWGPVGLLVGSAILYSALQPRTVYYEPRVVYAPPVYYSPATTYVQPYPITGDQVVMQNYVVPPVSSIPPPPTTYSAGTHNVMPGPGASGEQWWYVCKNPAGYYPYVKECQTGWDKVSPTPSGKINP